MKTLLLLTILLVAATGPVHGQSTKSIEPPSVNLRFAPALGDYLRITLSETDTDTKPPTAAPGRDADPLERLKASWAPRKQTVTAKEIGYDWRVQDRDAQGNTAIATSYAFLRVKITKDRMVRTSFRQFGAEDVVDPGVTIVLDTRHDDIMASNPMLGALKEQPADKQPPGFAELFANLEWAQGILKRTLIGRPFTLVVSPQGQVLEVKGWDVIMDQYRNEMSKRTTEFANRAQQDAVLEAFFGEDSVRQTMMLTLLPYPTQAVHPGDIWSDKFNIEMFGLPVTVTRKMGFDDLPGADGMVLLSGFIHDEVALPKQKGRLVIDPQSFVDKGRVRAYVDVATGMYRDLEYSRRTKITIRDPEAAADAKPEFYMDSRLTRSVLVKRLARRDPRDKKLWVFEGGNGAYQLSLGPDWVPGRMNDLIGGMLGTIYHHAASGAQLTTSVKPASPQYEQENPLNEATSKLKEQFETMDHAKVKVSWSKMFESGAVRWLRFRMEITWPDGEQQTYWSQNGYGPHGDYTFELTRPGAPSSEMDAEVMAILNSIGATKTE